MEQAILNLHNLLDKKIEYFNEIYNITNRQKHDIENNTADNIEILVNEKQQIIDKIDSIDLAFKQQSEMLKKTLQIDSLEKADIQKYPTLGELKKKVAAIMKLAEKIITLENDNNQKLNTLMDSLKLEMKQLKAGKKSLKAYDTPIINTDGVYIDRKK